MRNLTQRAFTLIELLIVVAIIAILAAIAVPNFLEAQTRSKVARSVADMRTIATAMESYNVDYNNEPRTLFPGADPSPAYSFWWGFTSELLTTPVAYLTSWPTMAFTDKTVTGRWQIGSTGDRTQNNQPYTVIRDTATALWPVGQTTVAPGAPPEVIRGQNPGDFFEQTSRSGYIIYTGGPDGIDSTVWGSPMIYDPTNGTLSYGDIYRFGSGTPNDDDRMH